MFNDTGGLINKYNCQLQKKAACIKCPWRWDPCWTRQQKLFDKCYSAKMHINTGLMVIHWVNHWVVWMDNLHHKFAVYVSGYVWIFERITVLVWNPAVRNYRTMDWALVSIYSWEMKRRIEDFQKNWNLHCVFDLVKASTSKIFVRDLIQMI